MAHRGEIVWPFKKLPLFYPKMLKIFKSIQLGNGSLFSSDIKIPFADTEDQKTQEQVAAGACMFRKAERSNFFFLLQHCCMLPVLDYTGPGFFGGFWEGFFGFF